MTVLPRTGGPSDGSLALIGLVLALSGIIAYRIARVGQPAAIPNADKPDSDSP